MNQYEGFETLQNTVFYTDTGTTNDISDIGGALAAFQSGSSTPIPIPTPIPLSLQIDVTKIVTSVVSAYRDVTISREMEKNKREELSVGFQKNIHFL